MSLRALASGLALAWVMAWPSPGVAQQPAAIPPVAATAGELADQDQFELVIDAPAPFDALLRRHLELTHFQRLPDLGPSELERLVAQADANVRDLMGTQGHFSPEIHIGLESPAAALPLVRVRVAPGPPTRVGKVQLMLKGDALSRPEAAGQRERLQTDWGLAPGEPFTQAAWASAKSAGLRGFTRYRYPRAQLTTTLADIDREQRAAHLYVEIDSGPAHGYGLVTVQGSRRYGADMAQRLVRLAGVRPGEPYDESQLQAAQQRLVDSGYYESAFVVLGESEDPASSPVEVRVREARLQKVVAGVGISTDNGARLSLEHTHHRVPGLDWRAVTRVQLERDASTVGADFSSPIDDKGWRWITGAQWQRQRDEPLLTLSQQFRVGQSQDGGDLERSFFLQYDRSRVDTPDAGLRGEAESAVSGNYAWTRRQFDHPTTPTRGHGLAVELGLGVTLSQERSPYLRARARWLGYWPVAASSERPSRLALRLEGGAVWSRDDSPVPATQRFLAGGDNSVRGYTLRSIGVPLAAGGVEAGRYLAVGSIEWQRPWWIDGRRSPFESTVFVDAGAVADRPGDLTPKAGVGTGVRYNSPVGPLQADLAYGLESRRWRLHLSVGFTF